MRNALAVVMTIGCAVPTGTEREAITSATPDSGDPGVVAIAERGSTGLRCTGTLIASSVVLTAGHCVDPATFRDYDVVFGSSLASPLGRIDIAAVRVHPQFDPQTLANDLAVVYLAEPAMVPAWPLATQPPDSGSVLRLVGFGVTAAGAGDFGIKRQGSTGLVGYTASTLVLEPDPSQPCAFDSGGPAFLMHDGVEVLAGITSSGDANCALQAVDVRVDSYGSFLADALAFAVPGAAAPGELCLSPDHCREGTCIAAADDPRIHYCAPSCAASSDCPSAMACDDGQCRFGLPTPGALGSSCDQPAQCIDGQCVGGQCTHHCVPSGASCPADYACEAVAALEFYCVPQPSAAGCQLAPRAPSDGALLLLVLLLVCRRCPQLRAPSAYRRVRIQRRSRVSNGL